MFHGSSVITIYSVLSYGMYLLFFCCSWASLAAEVVSAASHSVVVVVVVVENSQMIPPLQVVYTVWAPGPAYPPSLLKTHRNIFAGFGCS